MNFHRGPYQAFIETSDMSLCLFFSDPPRPTLSRYILYFFKKKYFFSAKFCIHYRYPAKGGYREKCLESESKFFENGSPPCTAW